MRRLTGSGGVWLSLFIALFVGQGALADFDYSASETVDGVVYEVATDKALYEYGDIVMMQFSVTNNSEQELNFTLNAEGDGFVFVVIDKVDEGSCDGEDCLYSGVWSNIDPMMTVPGFTPITLLPGETLSGQSQWDLTYPSWFEDDLPGSFVPAGDYILIGGLNLEAGSPCDLPGCSAVALDIQIVPEPAMLGTLAIAAAVVVTRRRR